MQLPCVILMNDRAQNYEKHTTKLLLERSANYNLARTGRSSGWAAAKSLCRGPGRPSGAVRARLCHGSGPPTGFQVGWLWRGRPRQPGSGPGAAHHHDHDGRGPGVRPLHAGRQQVGCWLQWPLSAGFEMLLISRRRMLGMELEFQSTAQTWTKSWNQRQKLTDIVISSHWTKLESLLL
jgi:hypothetical protein